MPSYSISNTPENLSMIDVGAYSAALGGLAKSARYAIRIQPVGELLVSLGYMDFMRQFTYLSDSAELQVVHSNLLTFAIMVQISRCHFSLNMKI